MKTISFVFAFTFLVSSAVYSQDTIKIIIDTSLFTNKSESKGEFGFYGTARYPPRVKDSLIQQLDFIHQQEIISPVGYNLINLRLVYTSSDTSYSKVVVPLDDIPFNHSGHKKKVIHLNGFFFKKPVSLLDCMKNGDTLLITKEVYNGTSTAGHIFPKSTLRIIKKGNQFYYSRNNLPTHADCRMISYKKGEYQAGFSEKRVLNKEQLLSIKQFETEAAKIASYSMSADCFDVLITLKGASYKFYILNEGDRSDEANLIWEKLE